MHLGELKQIIENVRGYIMKSEKLPQISKKKYTKTFKL